MATKSKPTKKMPFEKTKADREPRGLREGSAREEAFDRRQMKAAKKK